ncbi:MAG: tRNA pseudouridine(55) synthase TruB [Clostridia bacterium]
MEALKEGFVIINKPKGFTSHDVVGKLRKILHIKQIGHSGTLDPEVTGVMVLAVGRFTRLIEYIEKGTKTYLCDAILGIRTNTLDMTGEILKTTLVEEKHLSDINSALEDFIGEIEQIPPMFSAVHVNGKRLHQLARLGLEVERSKRKVNIFKLKLLRTYQDDEEMFHFVFTVICSRGTYIRSLVDDIGIKLGCGATVFNLCRTAVGNCQLDQALNFEEIEKMSEEDDWCFIKEPLDFLRDMPAYQLNTEDAKKISNGIKLPIQTISSLENSNEDFLLLSEKNKIIAVAFVAEKLIKPKKVFH